ncbi:uncharacterized protein Z518_11066 [Rhinocladiella mackenziei CBS 650.93]|uniref:Uncharacterized protein n=1 Tax=Rhinocladiella mackenziei CBS 650.93 TaxID=1442369 RepID=A0A0D2I1N3_9EURO|nr:uncharacterized protein Z518_11066 [Rhinocladiella mackenziei CBS 650.93]KIW99653.1 hypothetical protein Z518_11066 [Rhinocladiella mackenziei CBS 650.93]
MGSSSPFQDNSDLDSLLDPVQKFLGRLDRSVKDPHAIPFHVQHWNPVYKSIRKHCPALEPYADEPLIVLAVQPFLPPLTQSLLVSWVNGSTAQYFHYHWPLRLRSPNFVEAALVMIALYVFEMLVNPPLDRTDVRLVDDFKSLIDGQWVWCRKELVYRLTWSLTNVLMTEVEDSGGSPHVKFLSTILKNLFKPDPNVYKQNKNDSSLCTRFWKARFQGQSCQEAFLHVQNWVASPYRGYPPAFGLSQQSTTTGDEPLMSDSFKPRVPHRSEVKPMSIER